MNIRKNNCDLKKTATILSVTLAVTLVFIKTIAFIKTDSLAILSSLVDSVTDFLASLISFIGIRFATKPATYNHKYGYGKSEALSAFLQAIFVGASGVWVIIDGIKRLINPIVISDVNLGIGIMIFSIISTALLVAFQTYVANKTNSLAIRADRAHYTVDFLTNATVILSLIFVRLFDFLYFDVIAAIFISIYLLFNAYELAIDAVEQLTDKELPLEIKDKVSVLVKNTTDVHGLHDFRTRSLGDIYYFELHLEIDGNLSLFKAHQITHVVEQKIKNLYPDCQVVIHQDPLGIKEDRLDSMIAGSCKL